MFKGRKLLRLLLASSLSGVAFLQLVSCEFGSSSSEADRESEHQRQATAEAKVLATTRFNDATRNFEALEGRLSVAKSQFNEDNQKHKELEDKLAGLVAERDENERLITKLEASLTENKVSYPAVWEQKREISQEYEVAKRAYEAEKQRVSEVADDVISKLETARSSFEAFPKVINRVSNETYVAHWREFFLYIFGLKLIWGIFTGYRPTFVYPNQAKIQEEIDRYRYLAKDVTNDIARLEGFDFSKELVNEIQALGEGLEVVLNDIKQAPKNLVVLRERYAKALSAFDALKKRYLSENPDDVGLSKRSDPLATTADIALQDSTEAVELAASKNQLENYVSRLRQSADTISDLISNLILKIKSVEQAPVERAKFNELRDVFVKAENKERDHKAEEASLKQRLEEAKAKTTTFKQEIDRLNTQVKSSSEVVAAQKQKFEQISKQHEDAKNELEKAESELAQLNGDS